MALPIKPPSQGSQPLRQFLIWAAVATSIAIVIFIVTGAMLSLIQLFLLAAGGVVFLAAQLLAMWFNRQAKILTAVTIMCGAIAAYALLITIVTPEMLVVPIFGPLIMVALAQPYLPRRALRMMNVAALALAVIIVVLGTYLHLFPPIEIELLGLPTILVVTLVVAIILLLLWQNYVRLETAIQQSEQANAELRQIRQGLEQQVAQRTNDLRQMINKLEAQFYEQSRMRAALEQQREAIRSLSVPILPVTEHILVMPLIGELDRQRLDDLNQRALAAIEQWRAQMLLVDITGVPVVDEAVAKGLITVVQAARLLGAQVCLIGIRPEVAQALVAVGIDLQGIQTFVTLQDALARTLPRTQAKRG
ncbi:STAS domain-containing protein [Chloroflexus sp.]|uniref:STAS domain-containing protein n=1 Tax=Chloroflexus sp. TaxID=1904827 RepID=UPI00298F1C90|nr:STAS domain-containing protein [Chloroflexus sp.]MDW8404396.1 STAS domain-containing protein [Chloroflexus sp.]